MDNYEHYEDIPGSQSNLVSRGAIWAFASVQRFIDVHALRILFDEMLLIIYKTFILGFVYHNYHNYHNSCYHNELVWDYGFDHDQFSFFIWKNKCVKGIVGSESDPALWKISTSSEKDVISEIDMSFQWHWRVAPWRPLWVEFDRRGKVWMEKSLAISSPQWVCRKHPQGR